MTSILDRMKVLNLDLSSIYRNSVKNTKIISVPLVVLSINLEFESTQNTLTRLTFDHMKMLTRLAFDHNVHGFPTYHYGLNNIEQHDVVVQ